MMSKRKGSILSGRIIRPLRGKRSSSSSSAIFSRPPSFNPHRSSCHTSSTFTPSGLCSPSSSVSISSSLSRRAVMKMLAVMESSSRNANGGAGGENDDAAQDFLISGRTGRRNALPDILGETTTLTLSSSSPLGAAAADLPSRLEKLSCTDSPKEEESSEVDRTPSEDNNYSKKDSESSKGDEEGSSRS
ncbi:hypothetical protein J437_LFUL012862 [Ladona fulva]|uniref:Uncharacterized protein n=1 Tax=Ladona fulva TaxID=123851 RepID=A0A8K0P3M1_LADFU|nr:hypothetical protein J437_LFUL012862 [Ladona fulva]